MSATSQIDAGDVPIPPDDNAGTWPASVPVDGTVQIDIYSWEPTRCHEAPDTSPLPVTDIRLEFANVTSAKLPVTLEAACGISYRLGE